MSPGAPPLARGQIHWVDFSPVVGSEQDGRRPALIVSNNAGIQRGSVITVVPLTSNTQHARFPQNVFLAAGDPLDQDGLLLCGQVRTVSKERLDGYRNDLRPEQMREVEHALSVVLGFPKEYRPPKPTTG